MVKKLICIFTILVNNFSFGQIILNGDFEQNLAMGDQINLPNGQFNSLMSNCFAFGTNGNMDIITTSTFSGGPQSGNWFVALTGGETDIFSLTLSTPLITGFGYSISFYDKKYSNIQSMPIEIGLSVSNNSFGDLIYTSPSQAVNSNWTHRTFNFIAPNNGQFLTVRQLGDIQNWVQVDNFSFNCSFNVNLGNDTTLCLGQTITLYGGPATSYLWSNGSTDSSISVTTTGIYWLEATNGQCTDRDTIRIDFNPTPDIFLGKDTTLCQGQTLELYGGHATSYLWSNGSIDSSINVYTSGIYWLEATIGLCTVRDSINVNFIPIPIIHIGNDTTICHGQSILLDGGVGSSFRWSNGMTSSSISVSDPGYYWVQVVNQCEISSNVIFIDFDDCSCKIHIPNAFSPNGDGINELFELQSNCQISQYELVIYNRWGQQIFKSSDIIQSWDGYFNGVLLPVGEYVYYLKYKRDGLGMELMKGSFKLLR